MCLHRLNFTVQHPGSCEGITGLHLTSHDGGHVVGQEQSISLRWEHICCIDHQHGRLVTWLCYKSRICDIEQNL